MNDFQPTNTISTLMLIAQDMADDARTFDGKPFDGKVVGEYLGYQGAAVARIAEIVGALCKQVDALGQRVDAVMEQQGMTTEGFHKLAKAFATLAEESKPEKLPVDGKDYLSEVPLGQRFPSADELRPYLGKWVAIKAGQVIHSAETLTDVLEWLRCSNTFADSTFQVPAGASVDADEAVK